MIFLFCKWLFTAVQGATLHVVEEVSCCSVLSKALVRLTANIFTWFKGVMLENFPNNNYAYKLIWFLTNGYYFVSNESENLCLKNSFSIINGDLHFFLANLWTNWAYSFIVLLFHVNVGSQKVLLMVFDNSSVLACFMSIIVRSKHR